MQPSEDEQWSWWQENPDLAPPGLVPTSPGEPAERQDPMVATGDDTRLGTSADPGVVEAAGAADRVRRGLITLVGVLGLVLAFVSYQRFAPDSITDSADPGSQTPGTAASVVVSITTASTTATQPSTTAAPTTVSTIEAPTTAPTTTQTTAAPTTDAPDEPPTEPDPDEPSGVPSAPTDIEVVSVSATGAEIHWRSDQCVGSIYQVGDFEPGGGGYPDVQRCWFNHVVLAGDPAFSGPLEPNTQYTLRLQAVAEDGSTSETVEVQFTTTA